MPAHPPPGRLGLALLAAVALVTTAPPLLAPATAGHGSAAPSSVVLSNDDSASAGSCATFTLALTAPGGAQVEGAVVDVVVTERAPSAGQDVDLCSTVARGTDTGDAGTTDRGEVTTDAQGRAVVGVVATEQGTVDVSVFLDHDGDDVRDADELQDGAVLRVTPGGPAGSTAAADAVQCVGATPEADTDHVGEQHTVTVTLTNNVVVTDPSTGASRDGGLVQDSGTRACEGDTVAGVTPRVLVTGANEGAPVTCSPTSDAGRARCTYTSVRTGQDALLAFVDQTDGGTSARDGAEPADGVQRTLVARPAGLQVDLRCATPGTSPEDCVSTVPGGLADATLELVATVVRRAADGSTTPAGGVLVRFDEDRADADLVASPTRATGNGGVSTNDDQECVTRADGTCTAMLTERTPTGGESYGVTATVRGQDPAGDVPEDGAAAGEVTTDRGTVSFRLDPRAARVVDLRPEGGTTTRSGALRTFTAVVTDVDGRTVPGVEVAFTESGAGSFQDGSSRAAATTDSTGSARAVVTAAAGEEGLQQVTVTITTTGTQCGAAAGQGGTDTTPQPRAGACTDTEDNRFTTAGPSCSTGTSARVSPDVIVAGSSAQVTVRSTPGRLVRLYAYSRPSTTFRVVRSATATATTTAFRVVPLSNTRLYAQEEGCTRSPSTVLSVRSALTLGARRLGPRSYVFEGGTLPRRPGQLVSLYRQTERGEVLLAQARTDSAGRYAVARRFTGSGRLDLVVRTGSDLVNAGGSSRVRPTLVY